MKQILVIIIVTNISNHYCHYYFCTIRV